MNGRCIRCESALGKSTGPLCRSCRDDGRARASASIRRQIDAGMVPGENWKPGDAFWWEASGAYERTPCGP